LFFCKISVKLYKLGMRPSGLENTIAAYVVRSSSISSTLTLFFKVSCTYIWWWNTHWLTETTNNIYKVLLDINFTENQQAFSLISVFHSYLPRIPLMIMEPSRKKELYEGQIKNCGQKFECRLLKGVQSDDQDSHTVQ